MLKAFPEEFRRNVIGVTRKGEVLPRQWRSALIYWSS